MHKNDEMVRGISATVALMLAARVFALNPVGPGEFVAAETATDLSLAGQSFEVPANAATTNFPGVFCPRGEVNATYPEGSPIGVWQTVWRNVSLSDVQGFTARLSYCSENIGIRNVASYTWYFTAKYLVSAAFVDASVYHVTDNGDGTKSCQFQRETGLSNIFIGFKVTFKQEGADVKARIDLCRYAYKSDTQQMGGDFTTFGSTLRVAEAPLRESSGCIADIGCILRDGVNPVLAPTSINFVNTDTTAVADEELTNVVRRYDACLELPWVKLWPNTRLSDVDVGAARMIGTGSGGNWTTAYAYLPVVCLDGQGVSYYYQYYGEQHVRTAKVYFRQVGEDVWARVLTVRYTSTDSIPLGPPDAEGNYPNENVNGIVVITNDLAGVVTAHPNGGENQIQTLKYQTATRQGRVRHTVTVDGGFNPRFVPLRLFETKLAVAPGSGETVTLESPIYGYDAAIASAGAGCVALNVDLPQFFGLEANSGTVRIDADRSVGGAVGVAAGGALEFKQATGVHPLMTVDSIAFEPGAKIALYADTGVTDMEDGMVLKVVSVSGETAVTAADLAGVSCLMSGSLARRFRGALLVDGDGDIAVRLLKLDGLVITFR